MFRESSTLEASAYSEAEEKEIIYSLNKLHELMSPPYRVMPESWMGKEHYKGTQESESMREEAQYNKLRTNWFTVLLGNVDLLLDLYCKEEEYKTVAQAEISGFRNTVGEGGKNTEEQVHTAEGIAKRVIAHFEKHGNFGIAA